MTRGTSDPETNAALAATNSRRCRSLRRLRLRALLLIGLAPLIIIALASWLSLPYTFGRAPTGAAQTSAGMMPRRYEAGNLNHTLLPPTWAPHAEDEAVRLASIIADEGATPMHLFGTDRLGRDYLMRCLAGGAISLGIGLAAAVIAVCLGTLYGSMAGYFGGRADAAMMRIVDVLYGLPSILLVVLLAVAVDALLSDAAAWNRGGTGASLLKFFADKRGLVNIITLFIAIGGVSWLTLARVIRGQVLSLREQPFMEACAAIGLPVRTRFVRHLLPNLIGPIVVYATLTVPAAILSESFLSFLGIGVREPVPSWGNLAADGLSELNLVRVRWWLLFWPCLLIALTLLSLNVVGEALRDRLDPKRRPR